MSDKFIAENGTVQCTSNKLNLREGKPSTSVPKAGSFSKNDKISYVGYIPNGEEFNGISKWYKDANNNYFWSGAVKIVTTQKAAVSTSNELSAAVGSNCQNNKSDVLLVQNLLKKKTVSVGVDGLFGSNTLTAIKNFQKGALNFSNTDGKVDVGGKTWKGLNDSSVAYKKPTTPTESTGFNEKYKDFRIQGSVFPDKPIQRNMRITLRPEMMNEYLPAMEKALAKSSLGMRLLCTIMAHKEGYYKGTRSYRTNNPGNIGNTDSGRNRTNSSLENGILLQRNYVKSIIDGKHSAYPMNKKKVIKSYYSPEIAKHAKTYGMSPYLPGYEFVFTGQLDQFVKIYSTGARGGNSYLSMIISYFKKNNIEINEKTTLQEIVKID